MILVILISIMLFIITVLIHLSILKNTNTLLIKYNNSSVIYKVIAIMFSHTSQITLYAFVFYYLTQVMSYGHFSGDIGKQFIDYMYYSVVTYTSLGIGDVWPHGYVRLLTGVEALNGLFLIGWSIMYTYPSLTNVCKQDAND